MENPYRMEELKAYCKLDEELSLSENLLLERFYRGAEAYMCGAGVFPSEDAGMTAMRDNCVDAIVLESWDHRGTTSEVVVPTNPAFRRMLNQLKFRNL